MPCFRFQKAKGAVRPINSVPDPLSIRMRNPIARSRCRVAVALAVFVTQVTFQQTGFADPVVCLAYTPSTTAISGSASTNVGPKSWSGSCGVMFSCSGGDMPSCTVCFEVKLQHYSWIWGWVDDFTTGCNIDGTSCGSNFTTTLLINFYGLDSNTDYQILVSGKAAGVDGCQPDGYSLMQQTDFTTVDN